MGHTDKAGKEFFFIEYNKEKWLNKLFEIHIYTHMCVCVCILVPSGC